MASSKKSKKEKEKKKSRGNGAGENKGSNAKDAGANGKTKTKTKTKTKKQNEMNAEGAVEEPEVFEMSGSSSGGSDEEEEESRKTNGGGKNRNGKDTTPKKRRREGEEEEEDGGSGGVEEAKICRFPMNRIRRIMRSDDCASQIMQDAVFLVNKATEMFIEQFSEDAYDCSVQDRKKFLHYKHLSSVVSNEKRYEFLSDYVPQKLKAGDALEQRKLAMADAG